MNPLVSVIVPIYNTEEYLSHCIESILNQTYNNIEVILVDDGSTDKSLEICKNYALKDRRIKVIKLRHQGLVVARKNGVENSKGEYCIFVDSDDWIAEELLEEVVPLTDNEHVDIVNYNMRSITESGYYDWNYTVSNGLYENKKLEQIYTKMMYDFECGCPGIIQSLCTKLIRKKILQECLQAMDRRITMGEDAAVVYNAILESDKIVVIDKFLYFYRSRSGSMCDAKDISIFQQVKYFQEYMRNVFSGYGREYGLDRQLQAYLIYFIGKGLQDNFSLKLQQPYRVPFEVIQVTGKTIILYGAGSVGRAYYKQLSQIKNVKIVAWVDRRTEYIYGCKVEHPDVISHLFFDKILIAVADAEKAEEIREQLKKYVAEEQIIWAEPGRNRLELEIDI
ncbi:MAG: glycosyltransferase [Lachnospiraceae bacterium]|jgi:glycosyltransferase involved in cell wall biosynthesis|nr:glycosyltransferase [Lachnospiraceae bacterium]